MPSGKAGVAKKLPGKNYSANSERKKNLPDKLSGETRYEGYDEERTSHNTGYESDYDADENDTSHHSGKYGGRNADKISKGG